MYNVDYYIILYVNAAKKGWVLTDEEYEATPDIRAFGIEITDADRAELLENFAEVTSAINTSEPPKMDLSRFTFNSFKTACALSLTDDEFNEIKAQVKRIMRSGMPDWKKKSYYDAYEFITEVRDGRNNQDEVL
jgi:hypothetical protein